jgi:hypothetical protein
VAAGLGLTLASAVFYSWLGVLSQLAFDGGATVGTVLSGRFLVAPESSGCSCASSARGDPIGGRSSLDSCSAWR